MTHVPVIHITMKDALPVIREAYENKTLQMFRENPEDAGCQYAGPCAIGVCIPKEYREYFDRNTGQTMISTILGKGDITSDASTEELYYLEQFHDSTVINQYRKKEGRAHHDVEGAMTRFESYLSKLEEKYL